MSAKSFPNLSPRGQSARRSGPGRAGGTRAQGVAVVLCAGLIWLAPVAPLHAQTLAQTLEQARVYDAQFAAARKALQAALEKRPQARAGLLPSVTLSGSDSRQSGEASFSDAPFIQRDVKSWSWSAQLTQPLLRRGNWLAWEQADAQVQQAQAQFVQAEMDLMLRVAQAYFDVLAAQENIRVARAQLTAVQEQFVLAQRNYEVGTGTITDVQEVRARRAMSLAQQVAARNELGNRQAELLRLTAPTPNPVRQVDGTANESDVAALIGRRLIHGLPALDQRSLADWLDLALRTSPLVLQQQAALEAARKEVAKSQAQHLPTLDWVLSRSANYSSGSLSTPADLSTRVNAQQIGLQLTVPVFNGGAVQSRVRETLALQDKAQEELAGAQRGAASLVRQSHAGVMSGQAMVEALVEAVEAAASALESNKIGFRIGTRINPDVLNAQQQLFAAMRDLTRARIDTPMQSLRLKAAAGTLAIEDLQALDALMSETQPATTSDFSPQ